MRLLLAIILVGSICCTRPAPTPKLDKQPTVGEILVAFKAAGIPIQNEAVYTTDSDPNKLQGRPRQYVAKASWNDQRAANHGADDLIMTVELFASPQDLESRKGYVETVSGLMSPLAEYHFVHKNVLLRLNHQLTPQQAAEYERALKAL